MAGTAHLVGDLGAFRGRGGLSKEEETSRQHQQEGNHNLLKIRHHERSVNGLKSGVCGIGLQEEDREEMFANGRALGLR